MDEKEKTASQNVTDEEESQQNLEQNAQDESDEAATDASEQAEETDNDASESEEDQGQEEKPVSRRENLRIRKLIEKLREKDDSRQTPKYDGGLNYREHLEADDETVKQLESDRQAYGKKLYEQGLEQSKSIQFHTRLEIDAPRVATKYKQFDPDAEEFNPTLSSTINEWYLQSVGYDPETNTVRNANTRYLDFVEGIMELSEEIAGRKVATTTKNIAKQAASTGIRPNGSTAKSLNLNQAPEAMSDEELEAMINSVIPPRKR